MSGLVRNISAYRASYYGRLYRKLKNLARRSKAVAIKVYRNPTSSIRTKNDLDYLETWKHAVIAFSNTIEDLAPRLQFSGPVSINRLTDLLKLIQEKVLGLYALLMHHEAATMNELALTRVVIRQIKFIFALSKARTGRDHFLVKKGNLVIKTSAPIKV